MSKFTRKCKFTHLAAVNILTFAASFVKHLLHTGRVWHYQCAKFQQILKFHERVISALILVASFARPKISSQFLRVSGILKFALRYKFIKREARDLNFASRARNCRADTKSVPLSPFYIPQSPRTLEGHAIALCVVCGLLSGKCQANFKIYERAYHGFKFIDSFFQKEDKGTWITKPSPYLPLEPTIPSHVRGACNGAKAPHAVHHQINFKQILKFAKTAWLNL